MANFDADRRLGHVEADLDGVEDALRRLDDGSYGSCAVCGTALTPARLVEDPLADRCDGCRPS